jgi:hypothetical protein
MSGTANFESQQGQVQVYPNPVRDELTINGAGLSNYLVEIRNTLGQLVYKTSTAEQTIKVSFKDKAQGVYFVKVTDTQNREAKAFTIVK